MTQEDIRRIFHFLNQASAIAQQYPELDAIWGQIEDVTYNLDEVLVEAE